MNSANCPNANSEAFRTTTLSSERPENHAKDDMPILLNNQNKNN